MARQHYFKSFEEAKRFMVELDCYEVEYEYEEGVNLVDDGFDYLVTEDDGEDAVTSALHEPTYSKEQYEADRKRLIEEGEDPRCIMSYWECLAYDEWQAELEREREYEREMDEAYAEHELEANIAWLESEIAELDAEMEAEGVEDATAWEKWDELEKLLYAWAERKVELDKMNRESEVDEAWDEFERCEAYEETDFEGLDFDAESLMEMVEEIEEAAMVEREQFGCIEFEPQFNWNRKSTPDERGWSRAMVDIIAFEGEDAEPLFELF